jgi:guanosine-3',5'-bis(diphosphate) 3'-pyrophosphohydrolase
MTPSTTDASLETLLRLVSDKRPNADLELVTRAYHFSAEAHEGQRRLSGEPYHTHVVAVAIILAELHLDTVTVAAGLLHDVVEDTGVSLDDLRAAFGDEIADLVDGVSHIGGLTFDSPEKAQAENFRKMLISMARDIRVILIKLADRLHNMRTLQWMKPDKQKKIARETLDIYAPLAHRFGIGRIRWELEDLSFKHLEPEVYQNLVRQVAERRDKREKYVEEMVEILNRKLRESGIWAEVSGRPKHFYSIARKMRNRGVGLEEIYDLLAVRVVTATERDCYHALGIIHTLFTPVQDRFKDYIATPKTNMYQSLHTTVIGPAGEMVEVQIRTREMHRTAEEGIAAHWRYKEGPTTDRELDERSSWLRQVLEWQQDLTDPTEFMEFLKVDLFQHEVFVFTPKGELRQLPRGATPVDLAYEIHTEVGNQCMGARVNGRFVNLRHTLQNGDTVEIVTSPHGEPRQDWLKFVKTTRARAKIRHYLKQKTQDEAVALGREMLEREAKRLRVKLPAERDLVDVAQSFGFEELRLLHAALGRGDLSPIQVIRKITGPAEAKPAPAPAKPGLRGPKRPRGVAIQGVENAMIHFALCCQPVPGDPIVGFVTRGRGVTVHRVGCPNTFKLLADPERQIRVEWNTDEEERFVVSIVVVGDDRQGLLADVATAISSKGDANIISAGMKAVEAGVRGTFVVEVKNLRHLQRVLKEVRRVKSVLAVERHEVQ